MKAQVNRLRDKFGQREKSKGPDKSWLAIGEVKRELVPERLPVVDGYQVHALYQPSEGSGFDFYDVFAMEDKIALSMSGVEGDGTRAAMLALMARALIRASSKKTDPGLAMYDLNASINEHAKGAQMKCFYGLLDPQGHTLEYVNAGFNPPFIVDSGGMVDTLGGGGIALGMLDRMEQQPTRIPLQPEDVLVLYSDAVIEALNESGERFGIERLINLVKTYRGLSASNIVGAVEVDFGSFIGERVQDMDLALVIVKQRLD
jgi:sigma-B regulation protein RsbU (phosphoserine phosphatase)